MVLSTGYAIAAVRLLRKELAARGLGFGTYPTFLVASACAWLKARRRRAAPTPAA